MPGTVVGDEDIAVKKTDNYLTSWHLLYFSRPDRH